MLGKMGEEMEKVSRRIKEEAMRTGTGTQGC
jgi:hypothetical protein